MSVRTQYRRRAVRPCLEQLEDRALPATTVYSGPAAILRDANDAPATTVVTVHVPDAGTVADLELLLDLSHSRASDLTATLVAPDGRRAPLRAAIGGDQSFRGTVLANLVGAEVRGDWTLEITDTGPGEFGVLHGWSLLVNDGAGPEAAGNHDAAHAFPVAPEGAVTGVLRSGEVEYFAVHLAAAGYLEAEVTANGFDPKLALSSPASPYFSNGLSTGGGGLLATSDDRAAGDLRPLAGLYLQPGRYFVAVSAGGDGSGVGNYTLSTRFRADDSLFHPVTSEKAPASQPPLVFDPANIRSRIAVGRDPAVLLAADFNRDGVLDLATADRAGGSVTILLGGGDATFHDGRTFPVVGRPVTLVADDFNRDGRTDLAVLDGDAGRVTLLLGLGDGDFRRAARDPARLPGRPTVLAAADLDGDGVTDLVAADSVAGTLSLLRGAGDGLFADRARTIPLPGRADAVAVADFNADGRPDVALLDNRDSVVRFLTALPDGGFAPSGTLPWAGPGATRAALLVASDVNGDGLPDLMTLDVSGVGVLVVNRGRDGVADPVAMRLGDPTFVRVMAQLRGPASDVLGDFNRDGMLDWAWIMPSVPAEGAGRLAVVLGAPPQPGKYLVTPYGRRDTYRDEQLLGLTFEVHRTPANPSRDTPLVADFDGDGVDDAITVSRGGDILFRRGVRGPGGRFEAPVVVNGPEAPRAREVVLLGTGTEAAVAALDLLGNTLSVYVRMSSGWRRTDSLATGPMSVRVAAGDLDGDGRPDLAVGGAYEGQLRLYRGRGRGRFALWADVKVGITLSDVVVTDADGDGRSDVLVTDHVSGDVSVLINRGLPVGAIEFRDELRFRAGGGPRGVDESLISLVGNLLLPLLEPATFYSGMFEPVYLVSALEETASAAVGDFDGDRVPDLVVTNRGSGTVGLLRGKPSSGGGSTGSGSFVDAVELSVGPRPTGVAVADLDGDSDLDLAVLTEGDGSAVVLRNDGRGRFTLASRTPAGAASTGLTVRDVNGDGRPDLVVGGEAGDVLALLGRGDGTFRPQSGRSVALAVADLDGDGRDDVLTASESLDRIALVRGSAQQTLATDQDGILAPGAVKLADLNGDRVEDVIVANSGANEVLVYLGRGDGSFDRGREIAVGTAPVGLTVADVSGDGLLDVVVANSGSNDVSVLLGSRPGRLESWTMTAGPRLDAGIAPVATAVADVNRDGVPDLLVSNSGSNDVSQLEGLGDGFFDDDGAILLPAGIDPRDLVLGDFDGDGTLDLVVVNAGSDDLTLIADLPRSRTPRTLESGGVRPLAAAAGDVNRDGRTDLVVAHNGDGRITLFLGDVGGPSLARVLVSPDLERPSGLALSASGTTLFVSEEGDGRVLRFALDAEVGTNAALATLVGGPAGELPPAGAEGVTLPGEASLAFFATVLPRQSDATTEPAPADARPVKEVTVGVTDLVRSEELSGDVLARRLLEGGAEAEAAVAALRGRALVRQVPVLVATTHAVAAQFLHGLRVLATAGTHVAGDVGSTLLAALGSLTGRSSAPGVRVREAEEAPAAPDMAGVAATEPDRQDEPPRQPKAVPFGRLAVLVALLTVGAWHLLAATRRWRRARRRALDPREHGITG